MGRCLAVERGEVRREGERWRGGIRKERREKREGTGRE